MKAYFFNRAAILFLCTLLSCTFALAQGRKDSANEPLTNAALVKLTRAGFKEKTIIAIISTRQPKFDLSTESMIQLKKNGVSEHVILAMLARQQGMDVSVEDWGDDALFDNRPLNRSGSANPSSTPGTSAGAGDSGGNSTDIFGSSSGSKARSKTRGGINGAAENDIDTTGSATVHIIRPPSESGGGGGGVKLEKVASLNNESIIELIEAGFSEGTIVRRIEQSPVDFDLSPAKVDELRRRRVTDKILSAMRTAMGDNSTGETKQPTSSTAR